LDAMPESERTGAFATLVRGFAAVSGKKFAEAERILSPLAFEDKGNVVAAVGLVVSGIGRGDVKTALGVVERWHKAYPDNADLPLAAAGVFAGTTRFAESVECARTCLASRPGDRTAASLVTDGLARMGKGAEA